MASTERPVNPNTPNTAKRPATPNRPAQPSPRERVSTLESSNHTVIGRGIRIKGDIMGEGNVEVRGNFDGSISLEEHEVKISKTGVVVASVSAKNIEVHGKIEGDIVAKELVSIHQDSMVAGDITAPRVYLEDGSHFKGTIEMTQTQKVSKTAEPRVDEPVLKQKPPVPVKPPEATEPSS